MRDPSIQAHPRAQVILPLLVLLSGFCGISYEILYTKLLGNLLGNQFTINATVLLTFLLGIGLGTLYAHRLRKFLWAIELGIGVYAALFVAAYSLIDRVLYSLLPFLGTNMATAAFASLVLLAVPAFLVGCSVPLFAGYLSTQRATLVFSVTYGIYNVGAALTALAMEFLLLRSFGLQTTVLLTALLNGVVASGLLLLGRRVRIIPQPTERRVRFASRILLALALVSVVSAVFQLLVIKLAEFVFGPYNETFSLVLATVLIGLALGALAAGRFGLSFQGATLLGLGGLVWLLAFMSPAIMLYAATYSDAARWYPALVLLKLGIVFLLMGPSAIGFGATIPALLATHRDLARESGQLLFCSSVANAAGFMLMAFVLHRYLDYGPILLLLATTLVAALIVYGGWRKKALVAAVVLVGLATAFQAKLWDETLLYVGHLNFRSLDRLRSKQQSDVFAQRFKGAQDVFAITWIDDSPYFFINGYISIPLGGALATEELVGALSSMFAPRTDRALVLGMGTGATAGSVSVIFDRTDVVEINKVVLQNLDEMAEFNFAIRHNPRVAITHDDGIHFIRTSDESYSMILNTVTSPQFFSSSKLYTRDFLRLARRRLTDDGVYITWVDHRIGDAGIDIILDTLDDAFEHCWLNYVASNYYFMACSAVDLGLHQFDAVVANSDLKRHFDGHNLAIRTLPYSVLSTEAATLRSDVERPINTIDFPILEFEMARLRRPDEGWQPKFKRRLAERLDLNGVQSRLSGSMSWIPAEFAFFSDARLDVGDPLSDLLHDLAREQLGVQEQDFGEGARSIAESIGTAQAFLYYGIELTARDRFGAASELLRQALALDPTLEDAHLYLGRSLHALGDFEGAFLHYEQHWEQSEDARVPLAVARSLIELARHEEALDWLRLAVAARSGAASGRIAHERGRAYEGLGELETARESYAQALDEDPGLERARVALERLDAARKPGAGDG